MSAPRLAAACASPPPEGEARPPWGGPAAAVISDRLVPDWPAPPGVHALCTTRRGGVSGGNYRGLNLGDHVGDVPADVAANRALLRQAIGARPVFLQQVHGTALLPLDASTPDGEAADACTTTASGVVCTIMVADCLPVLLTDEEGRRVAAAHAGWRGVEAGVLAATVAQLGSGRGLLAAIGPSIGACCFEVGDEVAERIVRASDRAARLPAASPGKAMIDLRAAVRAQLLGLGLRDEDVEDVPGCTRCDGGRFYSYRRDADASGRLAAVIVAR
jgi:YfiH family protein